MPLAYSIPSKWRIYWGECWLCWKDDFAMNLLLFRQADSKSTTLDELRGRLHEATARIVFEPRTLQDCWFPPWVQYNFPEILRRWNENRNAYTGMDEIAMRVWFMAFASFLINMLHQSELLDWFWWRLVTNRCSDVIVNWRYHGLLKSPSDRILDNLKELSTLSLWRPFFSKFPHFHANAEK